MAFDSGVIQDQKLKLPKHLVLIGLFKCDFCSNPNAKPTYIKYVGYKKHNEGYQHCEDCEDECMNAMCIWKYFNNQFNVRDTNISEEIIDNTKIRIRRSCGVIEEGKLCKKGVTIMCNGELMIPVTFGELPLIMHKNISIKELEELNPELIDIWSMFRAYMHN